MTGTYRMTVDLNVLDHLVHQSLQQHRRKVSHGRRSRTPGTPIKQEQR